jgi:four helix bundle protein
MKSEELRHKKIDILERCVKFSIHLVHFYKKIAKDDVGKILGKQLLRSGTSVGANIHEAQGGQSKADFIAKMSVAHKEACETAYWLRVVHEAELGFSSHIDELLTETDQLVKILSSILLTAKQKNRKEVHE